ncbi:MAG: hypothetical protein AB7E05_15610 [Sphingobium sp.]
MNRPPRGLHGPAPLHGPAWVSAAWMSLMVVLAFALMPTGAPRTQAAGSAFDPSTQTVALKHRPHRHQRTRHPGASPANKPLFSAVGPQQAGAGIALFAAARSFLMLAAHGPRPPVPRSAARLWGRGIGVLHARAPPAP